LEGEAPRSFWSAGEKSDLLAGSRWKGGLHSDSLSVQPTFELALEVMKAKIAVMQEAIDAATARM